MKFNKFGVAVCSAVLGSALVNGYYAYSYVNENSKNSEQNITAGSLELMLLDSKIDDDGKQVITFVQHTDWKDVTEGADNPPRSAILWVDGGSLDDTVTVEHNGKKFTQKVSEEINFSEGLSKVTLVTSQKSKKANMSEDQCYGEATGLKYSHPLGCANVLKSLAK